MQLKDPLTLIFLPEFAHQREYNSKLEGEGRQSIDHVEDAV
jgi:hypothetical protein